MNANMSLAQEDEETANTAAVCSQTTSNTSAVPQMVASSTSSDWHLHLEDDSIRLEEAPSHPHWSPLSSYCTLVASAPMLNYNDTCHHSHLKSSSSSPPPSTPLIPVITNHRSPQQRQRHRCLHPPHFLNLTPIRDTIAHQLAAIFLITLVILSSAINPSECAVRVIQTAPVTTVSSPSAVSSAALVFSNSSTSTSSSTSSSSSGTTRIFNFSQYSVPHMVFPTSAYTSSSSSHASPPLVDDLGDLEEPYPFTEDGAFAVGGSLDVCQVCWCNKVDELDCRYRPDQPSEITLIPMLPKRDDRLKIVEM